MITIRCHSFILEWVSMCCPRLYFLDVLYWHWSHWKGLMLVWINTCFARSCFLAVLYPHWSHLNEYENNLITKTRADTVYLKIDIKSHDDPSPCMWVLSLVGIYLFLSMRYFNFAVPSRLCLCCKTGKPWFIRHQSPLIVMVIKM